MSTKEERDQGWWSRRIFLLIMRTDLMSRMYILGPFCFKSHAGIIEMAQQVNTLPGKTL